MSSETVQPGTPESIVDLLVVLLHRWRVIVLATVLGALIGVAYSLLAPPVYQAEVSLLPRQNGGKLGILGSVMEMSGLPMMSEPGNEELYGEILNSRALLSRIAARTWTTYQGSEPRSLYEVLGIKTKQGSPDRDDENQLFRRLRRDVFSLSRDNRTGYMELRAKVKGDPVLAAALANAAVDELDALNIKHTTSRAGGQFTFLEERLNETLRELTENENTLAAFAENNRSFRDSPALYLEYRRLEREVEASTAIWIELRRQTELANIEHHKDLSSIEILDHAVSPSRPISPNRVLSVLLGACLGLAAVIMHLVGKNLMPDGHEPRTPV